jgi:2-polyprenyl-3-methyl-5-hydroxy-6-metoxy-1,4-benzoquinol methylase
MTSEKYQALYADTARFMRAKLKWRGIHTVVLSELGSRVKGSSVLDVGCGFGRFSLLAARGGARVTGADFMENAISVARVLSAASGLEVEFVCADMESEIPDGSQYDIIYLGGVLEHLSNPLRLLKSATRRLAPGGMIVANCPNESNFRGDVSATLWLLKNYPMTASDAQMLLPVDVERLATESGLTVNRIVGTSYGRGWSMTGYLDLVERLPIVDSALRESGREENLHTEKFLAWAARRIADNDRLLRLWTDQGFLQLIPERQQLLFDNDLLERSGVDVGAVTDYFAADFSLDPWYCSSDPVSRLGGQAIYFMSLSDQ